jgi:Arc/MetJ-type ribon-helix-helix transcriptional regulator
MMYGVKRTTVYLPEEMKSAIEHEAVRRGVTEAEVIRSAVEAALKVSPKRRRIEPAIPEGVGEDLAGRVDELLNGLGSDDLENW